MIVNAQRYDQDNLIATGSRGELSSPAWAISRKCDRMVPAAIGTG